MLNQIKVSPVNSLLFMTDAGGGIPPEPVWGAKIQSTPTCISFACFPEQDGPTDIVLGPRNEIKPTTFLVFQGDLVTPSRVVVLHTAAQERVLSVNVAKVKTAVCIWYSHPKWPDKVTISLD